MPSNLERFEKDLDHLISEGLLLECSLFIEVNGETKYIKSFNKTHKSDEMESFIKNLPDFKSSYDSWYSISLVLLKQLLPARVANFISLYEVSRTRKDINSNSYVN